MFSLCLYHSLLLGRKKFGVGIGIGAGSGLGYCRGYSFNMGDLINCTEVLYNYLEGNEATPWDDMRYMFGEVFYGGHITDAMDRRLCMAQLDAICAADVLMPKDGKQPVKELVPGLRAPMPTSFQDLKDYVETSLPQETPAIYGLHSNAQLSLLTTEGEMLFGIMTDIMAGGGGGGGGGGLKKEDIVRKGVEDMLMRMPEEFNMIDVLARVVDKNPYVVCALQEATRMNDLIAYCRRSLEELTLGLDGALNMSDSMEQTQNGIFRNSVPPQWMAQLSTRVQEVYNLGRWYRDVLERHAQLDVWLSGKVEEMPKSIWLPGLFNAKAFITAVQQVYARKNALPLDVMKFMTEITKMTGIEQVTEIPPAGEGAYVHGLTLEGARWDTKAGVLKASNPKELRCPLPVVKIVPVHSDKYDSRGYYLCPVYANMQRANVYSAQVSSFTLKLHKDDATNPNRWTLASVALLLQDELAV